MSNYKVERLRGVISIYKDNEFYAAIESTSAADKLMSDMISEIQKLKEENKLLRECVEFIITESSNYDISNLNLIQLYVCKARQTLAKIKGE